MNERIKALRKRLGLTQQAFADRLKIARGNIGAYEVGKNAPSDAVISLICKEFNVNEIWLRTGEGDAYTKMPEDDLIKRTTELLGKHDPFFESLVYMYSELSDESRKIFLEKGAALFNDALRRQKEKE